MLLRPLTERRRIRVIGHIRALKPQLANEIIRKKKLTSCYLHLTATLGSIDLHALLEMEKGDGMANFAAREGKTEEE